MEDFLTGLHEYARTPISETNFYERLLDGCLRMLAAGGGAVWQSELPGVWRPLVATNLEVDSDTVHQQIVQQAGPPSVLVPAGGNSAGLLVLAGAVQVEGSARPRIVIELLLRSGASPDVQQGWEEFLAAVIHAAEEFELRNQLRDMRTLQREHAETLALLGRIHRGKDLSEVIYDIANEGSRYLEVDRLSILLRRGEKWLLQCASGVEYTEPRADAVQELEKLAEVTARWGEPIDYVEGEHPVELPPTVAEALLAHIDHSHARRLVAVPVEYRESADSPQHRAAAVLIAENFGSTQTTLARQQVVEFAHLCGPALEQVASLDRWPIRTVVAWTNRAAELWEKWGAPRLALIVVTVLAMLALLTFVPTRFEIEADARVVPRNLRDVFATSSGTIREIQVEHGQLVDKGTVLAVLDDPQLELEIERVQGELATVRKRLEAIAIARTDRRTREEVSPDRLPLSAEAQQLELRRESLLQQAEILHGQNEALTLRSPIAGTLLTLDVQNLLRGRPVERGQVLFTVADTQSGWQLEAHVPQDRVGHVLAAEAESAERSRYASA